MRIIVQSVIMVFAAACLLAGFFPESRSGDVYTRDHARTSHSVNYGTILRVDLVTMEGTQTGARTVAGGAMGGALGSAVGGGSGQVISTVGGAILGGIAGFLPSDKNPVRHCFRDHSRSSRDILEWGGEAQPATTKSAMKNMQTRLLPRYFVSTP